MTPQSRRKARSGYLTLVRGYAPQNASIQSSGLYKDGFWEGLELMLLGMGLFKLGLLTCRLTLRDYAALALGAYVVGLTPRVLMVASMVRSDFAPIARSLEAQIYDLRILVGLGHTAVVMMICKAGVLKPLTRALASVGQMALTNYLMQTVLCVIFFSGVGLHRFGTLERHELYYVVSVIWALQLACSPIWLRHFHFGPAEWLWRSLTYLRLQPMTRRSPDHAL